MRYVHHAVLIALVVAVTGAALAGSLDPPTGPAPTMKTLQEIYDKAEQIDGKIDDKIIPRTGQTESHGTRDDGALKEGLAWPNPRFADNEDGTITDRLTKLVWLKNANSDGTKNWEDALTFANGLKHGDHGLSDGSEAGDWRIPNIRELLSLVDYGRYDPALPSSHLFSNVEFNTEAKQYWSSTNRKDNFMFHHAFMVHMRFGRVEFGDKISSFYVLPVRYRK